jgi:hypothetical protein
MVDKIIGIIPASWRTTAIGVIAGLAIIFGELNNLLDNSPETVFDWQKLVAGLAALGIGWFARDKGVTSEQEQAK